MADVAAFEPTHAAPAAGLKTWVAPGGEPAPDLPGGMGVQLAERQGDWARVVCSNQWSTWVDARMLIDLAALQSAALDVVNRLDAALKQYETVINDAAANAVDDHELRRRALEAGMVMSESEVWFLDIANSRWCRYDGFTVTTLDLGEA